MSAINKVLIVYSSLEQASNRRRRISCLIAVIFFLNSELAIGEEVKTNQSPVVRPIQPVPAPAPPPPVVRPLQPPIIYDPRAVHPIQPVTTPSPPAVGPKVVQEPAHVPTRPDAPVSTKRIDPVKQAEIKRELTRIQGQIVQVRKSAHQVEREINSKQKQFAITAEPLDKQRLQMEIIDLSKQLEAYNDQLKNLGEQEQILYSLSLDSTGFADTDESLGAGTGGDNRWNTGGRQSHCFIATAAYGSPFAHEVDTLRHFRDRYLSTHWIGRKLIGFYYYASPPLAAFITRHEAARASTRLLLWPIVASIRYPVLPAMVLFLVMTWRVTARIKKKRRLAFM